MDREYIPVMEIIPSDNTNSALTIDAVFSFLCTHKKTYKLYLLPQGLVCWKYDPSEDDGCYNKVRYEKCQCDEIDRLSSTYHTLCKQYYHRLRANERIEIKYLCKSDSAEKGIFVKGKYGDGYRLSAIKIRREQVFLESKDFNTIKNYFSLKYLNSQELLSKPLEIHPVLQEKIKNPKIQAAHQTMWNKAVEIRNKSPKKSIEKIAEDISKDPACNINSMKADSIKKSIEKNPLLKKFGIKNSN